MKIVEEHPTPTPSPQPAAQMTDTYVLGSAIAIIIVILIIGAFIAKKFELNDFFHNDKLLIYFFLYKCKKCLFLLNK